MRADDLVPTYKVLEFVTFKGASAQQGVKVAAKLAAEQEVKLARVRAEMDAIRKKMRAGF